MSFEIFPFLLLYFFLALFSLALGSFLNVVIYRLPQMLNFEMQKECNVQVNLVLSSKNPRPVGEVRPEHSEGSPGVREMPRKVQHDEPKPINLCFPRSFCPSCKNSISAIQNIPILSYCLQKGCCKNCNQPIALRYPLVEFLACIFTLISAGVFGFNLSLIFVLVFIYLEICLFFIDLEHFLLPDELSLSLLWLGLIANTQSLFTTLNDAVLSAALAYLALWLFAKLFYLLRGKVGMGHGDFKLFAAFGAWFGWIQLPLILLLASSSAAIVGSLYLLSQNKKFNTPIPFGPFLCTAGIFSLFFGKLIMQWYLNL